MRQPDYSGRFKRDVRQSQKRGKDMERLKVLLGLLIDGKPLPATYLDHLQKGGWRGFRDAHIESCYRYVHLFKIEAQWPSRPLFSLCLRYNPAPE